VRQNRGAAGARQALPQLAALETVLADPARLVRLLQDAEDRADAVRLLGATFGLAAEQADVVLDNQFGLLVRSRRAAVAEQLRILRAPWGPPLELTLVGRGRHRAALDVDGTEHVFRGRSRDGLLDEVIGFLFEQVTVPQLRPVRLSTDLPGGPGVVTVWPSSRAEFEYPDDPAEPVARPDGG
jgi:hypothetical protein